jgi:serine/threonine-protein kinase
MISGTPAYLAPESSLGDAVDHRVDIYALGCVAYWMLTGRPVFEGDSAIQILARHIQMAPEPPSRYSGFPLLRSRNSCSPAWLSSRQSGRRSARELAYRLTRCEPESPWTQDEARQWWETQLESAPPVRSG